MINISKLPYEVLQALKNRGHSDNDIKRMDYKEAFDEYCNWQSLCGWGRILRDAYESIRKSDRRVRVIAESNPEQSGAAAKDESK